MPDTNITKEQIEQWKKEHGEIHEISDADGELKIIVRKPTRGDMSRFTKEVSKNVFNATNNLVLGCLVYPKQEDLRKLIDEKPGLVLTLGGEIQQLAGASQDFLSRKL